MKKYNTPPIASSLVESMRSIGYSIESAIADLIDNSITAESSEIDIRFNWDFGNPWFALIDDGIGMDLETLWDAMRIGFKNPLEERNKNDLGRFGIGLKTASFSQCRKLTVISKRNGETNFAIWDLDEIANSKSYEWPLTLDKISVLLAQNSSSKVVSIYQQFLKNRSSGTIVFWSKLDRITKGKNNIDNENNFNSKFSDVRKYIELTFHRIISSDTFEKNKIFRMNGLQLEAYDPFNLNKSAEMHKEVIVYDGQKIIVQPYILPHYTKISKADWKKYGGASGYLNEQGFYVYRNKRLIIHADWFRLIPRSELTKLIRIQVDIPNTLDSSWEIDVKKSVAYPPIEVKKRLKTIIHKIEITGAKVFRQKGQKLTSKTKVPGWLRIAKEDEIHYQINRNHPFISEFIGRFDSENTKHLMSIIDLLEISFPRETYYSDVATSPEQINKPSISREKIIEFLAIFIDEKEVPNKKKLNDMLETDPFASNKELTVEIFKERNYEF